MRTLPYLAALAIALVAVAALGLTAPGPARLHDPGPTVRTSCLGAAAPSLLSVNATAAPSQGPAPLTVELRAHAAGGNGVYVSYVWNFDDGSNGSGPSVEYTFLAPGNYTVTVSVHDSAGTAGQGVVRVAVTPAASGAGPAATPPSLWWGLGVGAGALVAVAGVLSWRRRAQVVPIGPMSVPSPSVPPVVGEPPARPAPIPAPPGLVGRPEAPDLAAGVAPASGGVPPDDPLRLSQRILLHLARFGAPPGELPIAPIESTQLGMMQAFGAGQSAIANALRRLSAAGAVASESRHVAGHPRRLRSYYLTPRGQHIARELRRRSAANRTEAAPTRSARPGRP
jgi:DNA-binding MarR family transcriptional regulator